jgi:hypothetical protein
MPIVQEAEWASEPVWTQRLEEKSLTPTVTIFFKSYERGHADRHSDKQNGDIISITFIFKEIRLQTQAGCPESILRPHAAHG